MFKKASLIRDRRRWVIAIDDEIYDTVSLAKHFDMHKCSLTPRLKENNDNGTLLEYLRDLQWKKDNDIAMVNKVYHRGDKRCAASIITELVPHLILFDVRRRLALWEKYLIDDDELFQPKELGNIRRVHEYGVNNQHHSSTKPLEGMQPRKDIKELEGVGSWEKEHLTPKFVAVKSRHSCGGMNSRGYKFYRGD